MNQMTKVFGVPLAGVTKAFTATAATETLNPARVYRFIATEDCHISMIEAGGTAADANDVRLIANVPEVFSTTREVFVVSVVRSSSDGNLQISEMGPGGY